MPALRAKRHSPNRAKLSANIPIAGPGTLATGPTTMLSRACQKKGAYNQLSAIKNVHVSSFYVKRTEIKKCCAHVNIALQNCKVVFTVFAAAFFRSVAS
jgi:hypothetical protein